MVWTDIFGYFLPPVPLWVGASLQEGVAEPEWTGGVSIPLAAGDGGLSI